jgi:hemolysin D
MTEPPVVSPTLRYTSWVLLALFFTLVAGSWFAKTEIVARGTGRVLPFGRTQTIQPQFSGQIAEIKVTDGAAVKAGDLLVSLDTTQANADVARLSVSLDQAQRQLAVHETILTTLNQADPKDPGFVGLGKKALGSKLSAMAPGADDVGFLEDNLKSFAASAAEFDAQIEQLGSNIATADTKLDKALQDRALLQERIAKKGGVSESASLEIKREVATADQEIRIAENQRKELDAQRRTTRQSRVRYLAGLRADQQKKVADLKNIVATTSAELDAARNRQLNTRIVSPVPGRVENLQVFTQGGFVEAGQTLMSVVPEGSGLELEALFQNRDSGFLQAGQTVLIKLDAYPAERFGLLRGKVLSVGADARKDEAGKVWVYAARIAPDQTYVEREGKRYQIAPGMTGTTDVVTGERRLISYFFEPVVKAIQDGFGEQ